jgi:gliding motility-associated-like protein
MQTNTLTISNPVMGMNGCQYQCIVSDQFNSITSQPATLTVNSLPNAYAGNDTTILIGNSVQLAATGGTSYVWTPSTYLDNPNVSNPISTSPLADISYIVYVTDANSCTASDTINITVDDAENIFIPNIFSPNGDGQNDILYVRGKGIKDIEFIVYDRWGEKIFETTTFNDITKGWDGTYKGKKLSTAVFVWYAKGTFYSGGIIDKKGNITLIRKNN